MSSTRVKAELQHLVEQESDERLFASAKKLLVEPTRTAFVRAKLTLRAFQAEEAIRPCWMATQAGQAVYYLRE